MSLFGIAFKNIKRNFYNYFLYFVSMIFSIIIYFTFTSIQYNEEISKAMGSKMISAPFQASSIVIAVFVAIFIWYSNSFFTKKRKNEVALYSMMGVRKRQIGAMLFYENLTMGIVALVIGIGLGGLLSRLFMNILMKLMALETIKVTFALVPKAVTQTSIVFLILFLIASFHSYTIIYRFKLVDLFRAEQTGESTPKASILLSVTSIIMIAVGYRFANLDYMFKFFPISLFLVLGLTISGAYLFFNSFAVFMVKVSKNNKNRFYRGINMIGTSKLLYRIKGNARSLATIAVLSATTLTAVGTTFSFYYNNEKTTKEMHPFSYGFISKDTNLGKNIDATIAKYPNNKLLANEDVELILAKGNFPSLLKNSKTEQYKGATYVISESKYNSLNKILGNSKEININEKEAILVDRQYVDSKLAKDFMINPIGKIYTLYNKDENLDLTVKDISTKSIINYELLGYSQLLVVNDAVFEKINNIDNHSFNVKLYQVEKEKNSRELSEELRKLAPVRTQEEKQLLGNFSSGYSEFYSPYKDGLEASGLMIFIGSFLGLVFLICTGSIIFFKQISEASADKGSYEILGKIGVTKKEMKSSIAKELLIVFLLPLILGLSHSSFALKLLSQILNSNIIMPALISYGIYSIIYILYYVLTVNSYYKIISEK